MHQCRNSQWRWLVHQEETRYFLNRPRILLGDFNDIKDNSEKSGGPKRSANSFTQFRRMLNVLGLHEVKMVGGKYTWMGKRYQPVKSKIDRVVANANWMDIFPKAHVKVLNWMGSDHRPLLLCTEDQKWRGHKLFRYDNRWRFRPEVKEVIQKTWQ